MAILRSTNARATVRALLCLGAVGAPIGCAILVGGNAAFARGVATRASIEPPSGIYVLNIEAATSPSSAYPPSLWISTAYRSSAAGDAIFLPISRIVGKITKWGQFDWQWGYLNALVADAVSHGKAFSIALEVGFGNALPAGFTAACGAGCAPVFDVWLPGTSMPRCITAYVPLPWVSRVQEFWSAAASALALDLREQRTYPSLTLIHVPGLSVYDEELRLPSGYLPRADRQKPCPDNRLAGTSVPADASQTRWQHLGYSVASVTKGLKAIATAFAKAFPDKFLGLSLYPGAYGFPNLHGSPSGPVARDVVQAATSVARGRVQLQADDLDTNKADPSVTALAAQYSTSVGWQSNKHAGASGAGCNGKGAGSCAPDGAHSPYAQLLENGAQHNGRYLEVWPNDVVNYPLSFAAYSKKHQPHPQPTPPVKRPPG